MEKALGHYNFVAGVYMSTMASEYEQVIAHRLYLPRCWERKVSKHEIENGLKAEKRRKEEALLSFFLGKFLLSFHKNLNDDFEEIDAHFCPEKVYRIVQDII